jgi:uncharacterized protein (TIGR03435 family)
MKSNGHDIEDVLNRHLPSASADEAAEDCSRVLQRLRTRPQSVESAGRTSWLWFAAAAIAAAIVVAILMYPKPPAAMLEVAGRKLHFGDVVNSQFFGEVVVLADGSRVEMQTNSDLVLERADDGVRVRLNKGGVIVNAAKQRNGHLYVQTKDVTVTVVGTVFLVRAEEQGSRVAVIEGEVRVQLGQQAGKKLKPGEQLTSNPRMQELPLKEGIAWSRSAGALLAALQQGAPPQAPQREAFDVVSVRRNTTVAGGGGRGGGAGPAAGPRNSPCSSGQDPRIDPVLFDTTNSTPLQLIAWAYGMDCIPFRGLDLVSGPDWIKTEGYDVKAIRPEGPNDYTTRNEGTFGTFIEHKIGPRIQRMLQTMLAERFGLQMHRESKEMPVYVLSVAKGGPIHTPTRTAPAQQATPNALFRRDAPVVNPEFSIWKEGDYPCCQSGSQSEIDGRKKTMADLAATLSVPWIMGRPVLDRTGLKGDFNYFFNFEPRDPNARPSPEGPFPTTPIFKVLEQVGLELKESKEKVDVWVIDKIDRPTEN